MKKLIELYSKIYGQEIVNLIIDNNSYRLKKNNKKRTREIQAKSYCPEKVEKTFNFNSIKYTKKNSKI